MLRQWIAEGCQPDADDAPRCVKIEVYPPTGRLLKWPGPHAAARRARPFLRRLGPRRDAAGLLFQLRQRRSPMSPPAASSIGARPRRGGDHRPLPGAHRIVLPDVRQRHSRLRLDQSAGRQLHRRARRRQAAAACSTCPSGLASDDEFLRRVYLDVIGQLPTLDETQGLPGRRVGRQAGQADRQAARPARVRQVLGPEVGRPAAA